jgi:hypothetical protein
LEDVMPSIDTRAKLTDEPSALVPIEGEYRVVRPLVSADEALAQWDQYQELVRKLIGDSDIQSFQEDGKQRSFIKKSGWQKLATYYGISIALVDERLFHKHDPKSCLRVASPDKFGDVKDCGCSVVGARYVVRATAPNGRSVEGIGLATFNEKRARYTRVEHDLAGKAYTRAVSRAVSAMVGAGEVSAEEKADEIEADPSPLPLGPLPLGPLELTRYSTAWASAPQDRRDKVRALLEREGYASGEFRERGLRDFVKVIHVLEGKVEDDAP